MNEAQRGWRRHEPQIAEPLQRRGKEFEAAILAPQWMPDCVSFLEDLSPRVQADTKLREDDVAPYFREFSQKCRWTPRWRASWPASWT